MICVENESVDAAVRLKNSREFILSRWEDLVRAEIPIADQQSSPALRDSLPGFLDHLAEAVKQQKLTGEARSQVLQIASEHAEDRASHTQFKVDEVIREYEILRKVIFEVLEQDKLLPKAARETILAALTAGMAEASAQIAERAANREKQIRSQLEETEYLFKAIFEHAASGKALIDVKTGRYLKVNRRFCEMHGYSEEELRQMSVNDITFEADRGKQDRLFRKKIAESSRGWTLEKRNIAKDGHLIWVLASSAILYLLDGTPKEIVTTVVDITEMKKAEEELRESEEYIRRIIESSQDCIKIIALDGTLLEVMESSTRHLEIEKASAVVGSNWIRFWKRSNEDAAAAKAVKNAIEAGKGHFIGHFVTSSGQRQWWDIAITPIRDAHGAPEKLLVVSRDVTRTRQAEILLQESEEKFRGFAESMPQIAFIADAKGNIIYFNQRHYEYFGVKPGETEGYSWQGRPLHHPDDLKRTIEKWNHSVETGTPYQIEYRLRRHDGVYRWHLGRAVPQKDTEGNVIRWFGTNTDIQEQKQYELEQKNLIESLNKEKELREKFVSTLTHDLRTPLSVIKMSAQILEAETLDPEASDIIRRILRNVSLSDQMIRDLLDTNRIRAGRGLSVRVTKCNMPDVISSMLKNLEVVYGPRFRIHCDGICEGYWDPDGIRRIAENLVTNAIKYGDANTPITIRISEAENKTTLSVHNEGTPILEADQKNLFDQFTRSKSAETGHQKGWGIGLTIVKGIADAHCADIKIHSKKNQGTTFQVIFPRDSRPCIEARLKKQETAK